MINIIKIMIVSLGISMLFGCGGSKIKTWFRDRSNDYVKAETAPDLKVPADTHSQKCSQEYQIPET